MGKWQGYTPEQQQAVRAQDREHRDRADEKLQHEEWVAELRGRVASLDSDRVGGYSLRNQALLFEQADRRGLTVTDVDGVAGWRRKGRKIRRGQRGLRIVAAANRGKGGHGGRADAETVDDEQQREQKPTAFRMVSVFTFEQTEPFAGEQSESSVEVEAVA